MTLKVADHLTLPGTQPAVALARAPRGRPHLHDRANVLTFSRNADCVLGSLVSMPAESRP